LAENSPSHLIRFLADVHVPPAIVTQARNKTNSQIDLVRWGERGEDLSADDLTLWAAALAEWRVVITADRGFMDRARRTGHHPGVIYIHSGAQGQASIGPIVELVIFLHEAVVAGAASLTDDIDNQIWHIT